MFYLAHSGLFMPGADELREMTEELKEADALTKVLSGWPLDRLCVSGEHLRNDCRHAACWAVIGQGLRLFAKSRCCTWLSTCTAALWLHTVHSGFFAVYAAAALARRRPSLKAGTTCHRRCWSCPRSSRRCTDRSSESGTSTWCLCCGPWRQSATLTCRAVSPLLTALHHDIHLHEPITDQPSRLRTESFFWSNRTRAVYLCRRWCLRLTEPGRWLKELACCAVRPRWSLWSGRGIWQASETTGRPRSTSRRYSACRRGDAAGCQ